MGFSKTATYFVPAGDNKVYVNTITFAGHNICLQESDSSTISLQEELSLSLLSSELGVGEAVSRILVKKCGGRSVVDMGPV